MNTATLTNKIILWGSSTKTPTKIFDDSPSSDEEPNAKKYFSEALWDKLEIHQS